MMKKYYVTGGVSYEREVVAHGETMKRTFDVSFDRFVSAESAAEAAEIVTEKLKSKYAKTCFGKINWVKIPALRVFELVMEKGA